MKIPFGFSASDRTSGTRPRILVHGNLIHSWSGEWSATEFSAIVLQRILADKPKPTLFLAAPFVHTFIHETIHLSTSEMEKADRRLLGFSNPPPPAVKITALKLNDNRAITIHSHLTRKGSELLNSLSRKPVKQSWHPAISNLISNLHRESSSFPDGFNARVFLDREVLQIEAGAGRLRCLHLNYLKTERADGDRHQTAELLLEREKQRQVFEKLVFDISSPQKDERSAPIAATMLAPVPGNREIKTVTRLQKKRRFSFRFMLKRNAALGLATLLLVLWSIGMKLQVADANQKRLMRHQSVMKLREKSIRLNRIAELERSYARFTAVGNTARQMRMRPAIFLNNLKPILPVGVWVQKIVLEPGRMEITLLDSGETEISKLIDRLGSHYGKASLKTSEGITLDKIPVRRYHLQITQLLSQE